MKIKIKQPLLNSYSGKLISSLTFLLCIWGQGIQPSWAEGSKELTSHGGNRPFLEWSSDTSATIPRQTTLQVYVKAGEIVNLGSSVHTSANGTQDIVFINPSGTQSSCNVINTGAKTGFIETRIQEQAGPSPNPNGYTPCTFTAATTGIYKVQFHAPESSGGNNPSPIAVGTQFPTDNTQRAMVAAWDITVRDSVANGGATKKGRVFTNYIAMNAGSNPSPINSKLYIKTKDGYLYLTEMNGIDPFGFLFFANSRGFIDTTANPNLTLYHSTTATQSGSTITFPTGIVPQLPTATNPPPTDVTHLIFFNVPDPEALDILAIPRDSSPPIIPTSFEFVGSTGNQTLVGVGGTFRFIGGIPIGTTTSSYQIILDTNRDGIYDANTDRVLQNFLVAGLNTVTWDGKDAEGNNLPALPSGQVYNAVITTRAGEYHFPMIDAENNPNGIKITMTNPPTGLSFPQGISETTVYYNDENYTLSDGITFINLDPNATQTASTPRDATTGVDSGSGAHSFSGTPLNRGYGDQKGIDTWTYFSSAGIITPAVIVGPNQTGTNVQGTKSVRFLTDADSSGTVTVGDTVQYSITYSNLTSTKDATNFVINDTLPSQLTFVSAAITAQTGNTPAIALNNAYNGTTAVALTNSGTLKIGASITITINATINSNNNGNPISNQASASFRTTTTTLPQPYIVLTDATPNTGITNPPAVGANFLQTPDDSVDTGNNTTSTADDDPTLFTVVSAPPKLLLVKRITAINGDTTGFDVFEDNLITVGDSKAEDDNDPLWPDDDNIYLRGKIDAGVVKPGDVIEYTIYFLSMGPKDAKYVKICDLVPDKTKFLPTGFNADTSILKDTNTNNTEDLGIAIGWSSTILPITPTQRLSNTGVDGDRGEFFPAGSTPSITCSDPNTNPNGAVVVNVTPGEDLVPKAITAGDPTHSYGFIRFKAIVQ